MNLGHDSPLLGETLDALESLGDLPDRVAIYLDRGYDSEATRQRLKDRGLTTVISEGQANPTGGTKRWVIVALTGWHLFVL